MSPIPGATPPAPTDADRTDRGPSVTSRIFAILGAFAPGEARLNVTHISRRTGPPIAPTHCLLSEVVRFGGLEREHGGTYRVGVRPREIGSLRSRLPDSPF